jgi:zinc transport system ATP-binding protein
LKDLCIPTEKEIALVDLQDVWVAYNKKWVLISINLQCHRGEILGIVGPNGSGKSTLLKVILGLIHPDQGTVQLFGRTPDKRARLEVGYLPQVSHADVSVPVTVLDVVLMGLFSKIGFLNRPGRKSKAMALDLLKQVEMAEHAKRPFGHLSGGQQQRVNMARTLVSKPKLLILDEPSTGIDSVAQEDFYELLAKLRDEQGVSVILVSHDIGVITEHADQIACLNRELHYHGEPDSCFEPEIMQKVFGTDLKIVVHDSRCATCSKRHP